MSQGRAVGVPPFSFQSRGVSAAPQPDAGARCDKKRIKTIRRAALHGVCGRDNAPLGVAPLPGAAAQPRAALASRTFSAGKSLSSDFGSSSCKTPPVSSPPGPPKLRCGCSESRPCATDVPVCSWMDKVGPATGQEHPRLSWFCSVGDLVREPPVPHTAQESCATPRKLRPTLSPGCSHTKGTTAKSCWMVLGQFGAWIWEQNPTLPPAQGQRGKHRAEVDPLVPALGSIPCPGSAGLYITPLAFLPAITLHKEHQHLLVL